MDAVRRVLRDGSRRTVRSIVRDHPATAGELASEDLGRPMAGEPNAWRTRWEVLTPATRRCRFGESWPDCSHRAIQKHLEGAPPVEVIE
jgi:hypothetical protein